MNRKLFLQSLALLPFTLHAMKINELQHITSSLKSSARMPVMFIGHGSPMNAIEVNEFSNKWKQLGTTLPKPQAILCVSAHWETKGTFVTAMEKPKTIHDFGGFPKELFAVQYSAPGSLELAKETKALIKKTEVGLDEQWGLDHGAWSIIKNLYPAADVPVIQVSLDYTKPAQYHYELGKELAALRNKGVLIIGSGNMVHNLGRIAWDKMNVPDFAFDWNTEASTKMKNSILAGDHAALINYKAQGKSFELSIPTPEHYLPLLYTLALKAKDDNITLFNDKAVAGSLSMTSVMIGQ
jgi:4,5-DOPA dioxygenase extradiol